TFAIGDFEHGLARHVNDFGIWVDEPSNKPWARNAVGLRSGSRHPFHGTGQPPAVRQSKKWPIPPVCSSARTRFEARSRVTLVPRRCALRATRPSIPRVPSSRVLTLEQSSMIGPTRLPAAALIAAVTVETKALRASRSRPS